MNTAPKPYRLPLLLASLLTLGVGSTILAAIAVYVFGRDDTTKGVFARVCFVWIVMMLFMESYTVFFIGVDSLIGHMFGVSIAATITILTYAVVAALFVGVAKLFRSGRTAISNSDGL